MSFKCKLAVASLMLLVVITGCSSSSDTDKLSSDDIMISEVISLNNYYAPLEDGSCYDWIELYNSSDNAINLKGALLSDNLNIPDKWSVPTDLIVEAHSYAIIYASGLNKVDEYGNIHTNFKLSSKGETLIFSDASGDIIQQFEVPQTDISNVSYGCVSDSDLDYYWFAEPSPKQANSGNRAKNIEDLEFPDSGVIINEYMSKNTYTIYDNNNEYSDWIEIYNSSSNDVSLSGYSLSDDDGGGKWFFPSDTVIKAGEYLLVFCSDTQSTSSDELHASFGLSAGDVITLYSIAGNVADSVEVIELNPNVSCGRVNQGDEFKLFASPTPGSANNTYGYELTSAVKASPYSQLYISEVLCVSDDDEKYSNDFIEIHNASGSTLSLKDYGLSKDESGAAFTFPDISISAGEYIVVYCSGENVSVAGQTMYAAFKLNQGGEDIYLFDSGGHVIDSMSSGKQTYGYSSGRLVSEKNKVYVFDSPTPGKSNSSSGTYLGYAPMPQLSSTGGYVSAGAKVSISASENCTIYYTTTGAEPTTSSSKYTGELTIDQTTVVRAIAYKDGYLPSQSVSATFLVEEEHSIPVVSVASDPSGLFSNSSGILSNYVGGLVDGQPNYESDEEREVVFEYYVDGQRAATFNAMARVFGETSRSLAQKSLALILSEKCGANEIYYPFFGENSVDVFSSLLLRPSGQDQERAHLRDEFCARILRESDLNVDYQEYQPVALYINGKYMGLYYLREKENEDYLVYKYGMTKGQIDIVKWERDQQAGSRDDYLALCDYCENNDLSVQENYEYVCSQVDIDSLIDWWIFETYVANNDTGNIRCYRDQNGGKWKWMIFDLDAAFFPTKYEINFIKRYMLGPYHGLAECDNSIPRNLLKNQEFRDKFITRYCYHIKNTFESERLKALLDEVVAEIEDEMPRQEARYGKPTVSYFYYSVNVIKNILDEKPDLAKEQLKEAFNLSDAEFEAYYNAA